MMEPAPLQASPPPPVLVVAGTHSGVGKTTITCGLMAAFASRGFIVQPFKAGPDFLDGKHHEVACACEPEAEGKANETSNDAPSKVFPPIPRKCINLDGWMMGGKEQVLSSFYRHAAGADLCIIEGVMGLHDSKDGTSDDGSTAQIAKWLQAPVVLVVDAHSMARSVAAMVLGYLALDPEMRLASVVVNKVSGPRHIEWIRQALDAHKDRLLDSGTGLPIVFAGAMPQDKQVAIPERHLGLVMPNEDKGEDSNSGDDRFYRLARVIKDNLNIDALLKLARTATPPPVLSRRNMMDDISPPHDQPSCRVGVAQDAAFNFYYQDNLRLLEEAGAELVFFSPVCDSHLPPELDALYIGGGYPELHASTLEGNQSLRLEIQSFSLAGGTIYAECGGLMFLAGALWTMTRKHEDQEYNRQLHKMCDVLPGVIVSMTPHMKMYYAQVKMAENPIFGALIECRGQKFHFSEVLDEEHVSLPSPFLVTPLTPGAKAEPGGYCIRNVVASYLHLHWASEPALARDFVASAMRTSPFRHQADAVSFVSAATEIAFAIERGDRLAGVTSVCDYPPHARSYPRRVLCRSPFDASTMTSEEVAVAMGELKSRPKNGPPGHWLIDRSVLKKLSPRIAFVQESCEICDASQSDVAAAIEDCELQSTCARIRVSPTTLEGMFKSIRVVGDALGAAEKSADLCFQLRQRLEKVTAKVAEMGKAHPRVLSLEGLSPLCVGGGWLPDVKTAAGLVDALGDIGGSPARIVSWTELEQADPDVLLLSPCSASTARTLNELHLLATAEFWRLRCVRNGNVYIIAHGMFSRPGPRLVDGVEMLATLLHGIAAPDHIDAHKDYEALKYECCVGGVKHCTTELASRFRPCFGRVNSESGGVIDRSSNRLDSVTSVSRPLRRVRVTRCSVPESNLPCDRSAHSMVTLHDGSVLVFAGEDNAGRRLSDTWKLFAPAKSWNAELCDYNDGESPQLGYSPVWEHLQCSKVAGEDVPTNRSNSAAVVCGDYLLVFGGWSQRSECLDNCELLHLETLCWTHCSTRGESQPSPRGNPTLVYSQRTNAAVLFGGWNRVERLNDVWILNMDAWEWHQHASKHEADKWPVGRTDHSTVLWTKNVEEEYMIVFGGSLQQQGTSSELWLLDLVSYEWQELFPTGPCPAPRTSHAAAIVGSGESAVMVIAGGTGNGSGRGSLLTDAWILSLKTTAWTKLEWTGAGIQKCRHTMTSVGGDKLLIWGGYDGTAAVHDNASVWLGSTPVDSSRDATSMATINSGRERTKLQERWQAEIPLRESDLPADVLAKAKKSSLPGALFKALHRNAVSLKRDTYIDPASGYSVFTETYLDRRPCCGNGCRHCPYGHINVPKVESEVDTKLLEW